MFQKSTRDHLTGLNTTAYTIESRNNIVINGSTALTVGVRLVCNIRETPWCTTPRQLESYLEELKNSISPQAYGDLLKDMEKFKMIRPVI